MSFNFDTTRTGHLPQQQREFLQKVKAGDVQGVRDTLQPLSVEVARNLLLTARDTMNYDAAQLATWAECDAPPAQTPAEKLQRQTAILKIVLDKSTECGIIRRILARTNNADPFNLIQMAAGFGNTRMPFLKIPLAYCTSQKDMEELLAIVDAGDPSRAREMGMDVRPEGTPLGIAKSNDVRDVVELLTHPDCWKICREFYREYYQAGDPPNADDYEQLEDYIWGKQERIEIESGFENRNYKPGMTTEEKYEIERSERKRLEKELRELKAEIELEKKRKEWQ